MNVQTLAIQVCLSPNPKGSKLYSTSTASKDLRIYKTCRLFCSASVYIADFRHYNVCSLTVLTTRKSLYDSLHKNFTIIIYIKINGDKNTIVTSYTCSPC